MNRSITSSGPQRRRMAAALAAIGVLAVVVNTAADAAYGPEPSSATAATDAATSPDTSVAAPADSAAGSATSVDPDAIVRTAESDLGTILVDNAGMTLYAFLADTEGESTCFDDCATNWPPLLVEGEPDVGAMDASLFSTVEHPSGAMLKFGDWPLYTFAGDEAPGDVNGQGVGDVWYVVGPETAAPATLVNTRESDLGTILVDAQGMTLYAFLNDTEGESVCFDDCATNWPPALVGDHDVSLLDPALYSTVEHPAGAMLKIGDWPLYTFAGDEAPGDTNGQDVGEVWYVVGPDGAVIHEAGATADTSTADTSTAGSAPAADTTPATTG